MKKAGDILESVGLRLINWGDRLRNKKDQDFLENNSPA